MKALCFLVLFIAFGTCIKAKICLKDVCEYEFVVHSTRTMVWKGPRWVYDVKMNGTNLQVIGNKKYLAPADENVGKFVNEDEVITGDGFKRSVITINGQFPGPAIEVRAGAQVVVRVMNKLIREVLTIHWHGMTMKGTPWMDGSPNINQCPIQPDQSFTYRFIAEPAGTHWYHSHVVGQRIDGLFGLLVVHPKLPEIPEFPLLVGDWFHVDGKTMELISPSSIDPLDKGSGETVFVHPKFRDYTHDNVEAAAVTWQSGLINGRGRHGDEKYPLSRFNVTRGQKYRFRMANVGAEFTLKISIDGHELTVVALDGHEVEPFNTDFIYIDPGESLDFEMTANQIEGRYWLRAESPHDYDAFKTGDGKVHDVKAVVVYDGIEFGEPTSKPIPCTQTKKCLYFNCPFGTFAEASFKTCININDVTSKYSAEDIAMTYGVGGTRDVHEIFLNIGYHIAQSISARRMVMPSAPLYQKGARIVNCEEECKGSTRGCKCTNLIPVPFNKTIQMVISNYQPVPFVGHHPMHLHGHNFAVLHTGFANHDKDTGHWVSYNTDVVCDDDSRYCQYPRWNMTGPLIRKARPVIKDTVHVPARGYVVIMFKSLNPGYWWLHCHMNHHLVNGMSAILWEGDGYYPPPPENFPTCNDFSYTEQQFDQQMGRYREFFKSSGGRHHLINEEVVGNGTDDENQNKIDDKTCFTKVDHMTIKTSAFIGTIIGCLVIGFIIALIPVCIYIKWGTTSLVV